MSKPLIRLIHWHAAEAEERASVIREAGYDVVCDLADLPGLRGLRDNPPAACVIDLTRVPSHGRDIGVRIRQYKPTRHVPLVFVGGAEEKVARVREILPDAIYTSWKGIRGAIRKALAAPPAERVVPGSAFAAFAGTPLVAKLGIKPGMLVAMVNAPEEFEEMLGDLPEGVRIARGAASGADLTFWFVRSRAELEADIAWMRRNVGRAGIWIAWPKKSAAPRSDITQFILRHACNDAGLVDYKICSLDGTWSAMRFSVRTEKSGA